MALSIEEEARRWVEQSRAAQGLSEKVDDADVVREVAAIVGAPQPVAIDA